MTDAPDGYRYQLGFSAAHSEMYDPHGRAAKAEKAIAVMRDFAASPAGGARELSGLSLLDIGSSTGYLASQYARAFGHVTGVDIDEPAVLHAQATHRAPNLTFAAGDSMKLEYPDASFDAVTCTHIYEHVPDQERLMGEILRVLKPGGFCYFAAGNRLGLMEAHYRLPFLSWPPKWVSHRYLRLMRKGDEYYETHRTLWGLRRLAAGFIIHDYTLRVIRHPERFAATDMLKPGTFRQRASAQIAERLFWICPTYLWVLQKPR
ncbi:MAG: methyltransferase domain-containing protein [Dehalococcoidia bacterium]